MSPVPSDVFISRMQSMASLGELTKRHVTMPLAHIKNWKPFQIDALGLVTLLGADEVNQSVGTLQHRRFTEYLPLLAAFVIAGDRFVTEQPGFVLYNLTDGITSTELQGWFTRWLMSQPVNSATTVLEWKPNTSSTRRYDLVAPLLSFVLVMPLLVVTTLIGDWYGVGNAAAIIISISTRVYLVSQRRRARDKVANQKNAVTTEHAATTNDAVTLKEGTKTKDKRLCIIRSDGRMITCVVPHSVLKTFVGNNRVKFHNLYHCARWLCWLALGVHMCILGMCSLFTQIYTVLLLVLSTWWFTTDFVWDVRREKEHNSGRPEDSTFKLPFNREWFVEQIDPPKEKEKEKEKKDKNGETEIENLDRRQIAWARMDLEEGEEEEMDRWNLFPIRAKNPKWWDEYERLKKEHRDSKNKKSSDTTNEKSSGTPPAQTSTARPQMPSTPTPSTNLLAPADTLSSSVSSTSTPDPSRDSSPGITSTTVPPPQTNSSSL
jgi:hypothetical protein